MICREEYSLGIDCNFSNQCVSNIMKQSLMIGKIIPQVQLNGIRKIFYGFINSFPKTGNIHIQALGNVIFAFLVNYIFHMCHMFPLVLAPSTWQKVHQARLCVKQPIRDTGGDKQHGFADATGTGFDADFSPIANLLYRSAMTMPLM